MEQMDILKIIEAFKMRNSILFEEGEIEDLSSYT